MAPGVRLYVLELGSILLGPGNAICARAGVTECRLPVCACLIQHPAGNVLFDTGMAPRTVSEPAQVWGSLLQEFTPVMREEDHVLSRLSGIGLKPDDIGYVVLSHLHCDHAGGLSLFPNAECILQRAELETEVPEPSLRFYAEAYWSLRRDGVPPEGARQVRLVDGDIDLFGDGSVMVIATPGHSPGHQSLLLRLDRTGDVLIAADAGCDREQVDEGVATDGDWCPSLVRRSMARLRRLRECCALTIYGHDPDAWPQLTRAPGFYD